MTKEEIKEMYSMRDIVFRYGIPINRSGFSSCPFHTGDNSPSLKVYKDNFHCHACGADGDIFTFVMMMDNLSFKEAFESLGGTNDMSFTSMVKTRQAKAKREAKKRQEAEEKAKLKRLYMEIDAYRNIVQESEPLSDLWTYAYNKLQYRIYLLEEMG